MSQTVNVQRATLVVCLVDADLAGFGVLALAGQPGGYQIAVEQRDQAMRLEG